jgi:hypothetical protein
MLLRFKCIHSSKTQKKFLKLPKYIIIRRGIRFLSHLRTQPQVYCYTSDFSILNPHFPKDTGLYPLEHISRCLAMYLPVCPHKLKVTWGQDFYFCLTHPQKKSSMIDKSMLKQLCHLPAFNRCLLKSCRKLI